MTADASHFERLGGEAYERARPPYPDALWAHLSELGLLRPGSAALDLGAGTGQATGPLLAAGLDVTAIEPGPSLATVLAARHPAARVLVRRAEDVALPPASVDLAVAATSLHWMDLDVVLPAVRDALRDHGRLAAWWSRFGDDAVRTPFRDRVQAIVDRRPPAPPRPHPDDDWGPRLTAGGWFALREQREFRWSIDLDAARVRALFGSFSDWTAVEADAAARAVDELGGRVREHYRTALLVLSPRRASAPETRRLATGQATSLRSTSGDTVPP